MPIYEYEHLGQDECQLGSRFELTQAISSEKLTR